MVLVMAIIIAQEYGYAEQTTSVSSELKKKKDVMDLLIVG